MTNPKRVLGGIVAVLAASMVVVAVYAAMYAPNRAWLAGIEVIVIACTVLPWFVVYAWRSARRFSRGDEAERAWHALAFSSILLLLGQVAAYAPASLDLGSAEPVLAFLGQILPAIFRITLWWVLWRMRRAYRATGIDFRLGPFDYTAAVIVGGLTIVLILRRDVLFDYWSGDTTFSDSARALTSAAQVLNFVLYPAVFYASLAMSRYAVQMGGGLISRAWCGIAMYGLLQPLHALAISLLWPMFGPSASLAFDNFIVLAAYAALAFGPIYQLAATEVSRE